MTKTVYKTHPITIIQFLRPYVLVFALPFVRYMRVSFKKGAFKLFSSFEMMLFVLVIVIAVLRWLSISITVGDKNIIIKRGLFIKSCFVIEKFRVSSISINQNVLDYIFCSAKIYFNTEAVKANNTNFVFKLFKKDAKMLYNAVFYEENTNYVKFSVFRMVQYAATTSSAITGIIVFITLIKQVNYMLGGSASDVFLKKINDLSTNLIKIFPPLINAVAILFIIAYIASLLIIFIKNTNFMIGFKKNSITIQKGFIVRQMTTINKQNVNSVSIEQTPLMRFFKKYLISIAVGEYKRGRGTVIVPIANYKEIVKYFKTHFSSLKKVNHVIYSQQTKTNFKRALFLPTLIASAIIGLVIVFLLLFSYYDRFILFVGVIAMFTNSYYVGVCYYNYKNGGFGINKNIYASGSNGFHTKELYCDKRNVGKIKILQTPADKHYKTCKIKILVRSNTKEVIKIKNIGINPVLEQIKDAFCVNF